MHQADQMHYVHWLNTFLSFGAFYWKLESGLRQSGCWLVGRWYPEIRNAATCVYCGEGGEAQSGQHSFVKCNLKPLCHRKPLLVRVVEWATVTAWSSSRRYFSDGKGNTEVVDEGKEVSAGSYWLRRPHILYGRSLLFFALFHFSVFLGRWQSSMAAL